MDYEFPDASDKVNFAEWVKDIKAEFQQYNYEVINLNSPLWVPRFWVPFPPVHFNFIDISNY